MNIDTTINKLECYVAVTEAKIDRLFDDPIHEHMENSDSKWFRRGAKVRIALMCIDMFFTSVGNAAAKDLVIRMKKPVSSSTQ